MNKLDEESFTLSCLVKLDEIFEKEIISSEPITSL